VQSEGEEERDAPRPSDRVPPRVSPFRWLLWWVLLFFALILFYGLFAPFWFGLRLAAWTAEFRARRQRAKLAGQV
jgi:hypothetical protein